MSVCIVYSHEMRKCMYPYTVFHVAKIDDNDTSCDHCYDPNYYSNNRTNVLICVGRVLKSRPVYEKFTMWVHHLSPQLSLLLLLLLLQKLHLKVDPLHLCYGNKLIFRRLFQVEDH